MYFSRSFKRKVKRVLGTLISIAVKVIDYVVAEYQPELEEKSSVSEPPMDPKKPAVPISYPLKTLKELEDRSYFDSFHFPFNKSSVPLPPHRASKPMENRSRLLVCHDMKGGYVDDKWVQGNENSKAYAIWHWHLIDIFVYFSHNLVTLPPPCWTNTAHRHGVQVLGTFLTEWAEGASICKTLLASKECAEMYADRLTELAIELGFDGWLINMEVKLDLEQVTHLKEFVDHLTVSMHESLPGSLVIWYDSVTKDGHLLWQNKLNEENKPFFDICDGIFVNYTWQKNYPEHSALVAGERRFDVYMGIDVFGRNTYGGGQWTTNLALEVAKEAAVSVAIFAPGWVYETNQVPNLEDANNRWWGLVGQSWPSAQTYPEVLPFFSSFDQGRGKGTYIEGKNVSDQPWSNISCQFYQPLLEVAPDSLKGQLQSFTDFDLAYDGGACITITGDMEEGIYFMTKLFHGTLGLENSPLRISYSVRSEEESRLCLALHLSNSVDDDGMLIFLAPEGSPTSNTSNRVLQLPSKSYKTAGSKFSKFNIQGSASLLQLSNDWHLQEYTLKVDSYELTTIYAVSYKGELDGGKVLKILNESKFVPSSPTEANEHQEKQNAVSAGFESSSPIESTKLSYHASLGHISLISLDHEQNVPQPDSWEFSGNNICWDITSTGQVMLSTKLVWRPKMGTSSDIVVGPAVLRYDLYVEKVEQLQAHNLRGKGPVTNTVEHLGVALIESFYVSQLLVPPGCRTLTFFLQVCSPCGDFQPLKDSPSLSINVPSE